MAHFTIFVFFLFTLFTSYVTTSTTPPPTPQQPQELHDQEMMQLMLQDGTSKLSDMGFSKLSRAMEDMYAELVALNLNNMTVFALDDAAISNGYEGYMSRVRFHMVPNHFLRMVDLERLPVGTMLPTLERGQSLVVTSAGAAALRINDVGVKLPNVILLNDNIAVQSLFMPLQRIHPTAVAAALDDHVGGGD